MPALEEMKTVPREDFTIDAFRHLEGRLHEVRKLIMRVATDAARRDRPDSEVYPVERQHVDFAFTEILSGKTKYANALGIG